MSPRLIDECTEKEMSSSIGFAFKEEMQCELQEEFLTGKGYESLSEFSVTPEDYQTIKVQLKALGLIEQSERNRSVKDKSTYWTLTQYGETVMARLRAIRREDSGN